MSIHFSSRLMKRTIFGFNTCELLIICGFIGLLAMAALPNFGDARTLSDVARVKKDLATLARAMESYRLDNKTYPAPRKHVTWLNPTMMGDATDVRLLSTPVAYINACPKDVFRIVSGQQSPVEYRVYAIGYTFTTNPAYAPANYRRDYDIYPRVAWMTWSYGPDLLMNTGGWFSLPNVIKNEASPAPAIGTDKNGNWLGNHSFNGMRYDPTNGTVSYGEIYYFGGEARTRLN